MRDTEEGQKPPCYLFIKYLENSEKFRVNVKE